MDDESEDERIESEFRLLFMVNKLSIKPFMICIGFIFITILTIAGIIHIVEGKYFSFVIHENIGYAGSLLMLESCAPVSYCNPFRTLYLIQDHNFETIPKWSQLLYDTNYSLNSDIISLLYNKSNEYLLEKYKNQPRITIITDFDKTGTLLTSTRNLLYNYSLQNELELTKKSINESCLYKYFAFVDHQHIEKKMINYYCTQM